MNRRRAGVLARDVARLARMVAETETRLAATLDRLAVDRPHRGAQLREHAQRAREFAALKHEEANRWEVGP